MRGYVKRVNPAHAEVRLAEPYATAGLSRQDSGITQAMHPAYLEWGLHPRLLASDLLSVEMATDSVREQSLSRSTRFHSQFPSTVLEVRNRPSKCHNQHFTRRRATLWGIGRPASSLKPMERGCQLNLPIDLSSVNSPRCQKWL